MFYFDRICSLETEKQMSASCDRFAAILGLHYHESLFLFFSFFRKAGENAFLLKKSVCGLAEVAAAAADLKLQLAAEVIQSENHMNYFSQKMIIRVC